MFRKFLTRWIVFIVLLIFSLYMTLKTSFPAFYFLFCFLLVSAAMSFIWVIVEYFGTGFTLNRSAVTKIVEGETLIIETELKNKGFLPTFFLILEDYLSSALPEEKQKFIFINYLGIWDSRILAYGCLCPQRGFYRIGPFRAYFFDPLGLFFLKKTFHVYSEVYVYPQTFIIRKFPALTRGAVPWFGVETMRVSGDEDEFYGIREYRQGDPIKKIHWMSSARRNQLIVKQFQRQSFFRASIMFNLEKDKNFGEGKECVAEYTIKIVASVARYLIAIGASLEIIAHVGEIAHIPFNKGPEHLEDILKFLSVAKAESRVNLLEVFDTFHSYIADDSTLITVMVDTDCEYLSPILSLQSRNVAVLPIILLSSTFASGWSDSGLVATFDTLILGKLKLSPVYIGCGENLESKFLSIL